MLKKWLKNYIEKAGYQVIRDSPALHQPDMEAEFKEMFKFCEPYTMTSIERMYALFKAIEYIVKNKIEGDLIECGVWRGGSAMLMAKALKHFGDTSRNILLYDTFEGMTPPSNKDVTFRGENAEELLKKNVHNKKNSVWCYADLEDVTKNLASTAYPADKLFFIQGRVEDTIPQTLPEKIALLRLDTDWYDSTYHELTYLYPLLVAKGILIIDDYGHWQGAKEATDQYFAENKISILLNRIDYTARIAVKS